MNRKDKDNLLENFLTYRFSQIKSEESQTNPSAFLLTEKERTLLEKAAVCMSKVNAPYMDIYEQNKSPELLKVMITETFKAFEDEKLNIKKLRSMTEKAKQGLFWSIAPGIQKTTDKNGVIVTAATLNFKITVSTEEQLQDIILDDNHPFFKAETMQARAQALGLSELYLYVSNFELNTLETLTYMFTLYDKGHAETPAAPIDTSKFHYIISSPIMNALTDVGANAKKAQVIKKKNEKGQQIEITEILTKSGGKLTLTDFNPYLAGGFISVGDPNTDKLLLQAQIIAMQTGQQSFEITIDDFMKFRKLSDKKAALERAEQACRILRRAGYDIQISDKSASITGGWNYTQKCFVKHQRGNAGNVIIIELTNDVFNHVIELSRKGQQIEQFDKRITTIPDNQNTAYNIARKLEHHIRFNAGKRNEHIIGVKTLIECCPLLPLYPELTTDAGKENYLRFPSEAPQRIIKPFIKGLDFITKGKQKNADYQIIERYIFRHKKGSILTDAELSEALKDYKSFTNLNIEFELCNEPNYQNVIESKARREEKSETTPKKAPGKAKKKKAGADPGKDPSKA